MRADDRLSSLRMCATAIVNSRYPSAPFVAGVHP